MWLVVYNRMRVDEARDDVEWWPEIIASARKPPAPPLFTGGTKTAELAWDLVEALAGNPPPRNAYLISIEPADVADYP